MSADRSPERLAACLRSVADEIAIDGVLVDISPYGNGHINDTMLGVWHTADGVRRFLHQRLNPTVFPDLDAVMANVAKVCDHLATKVPADQRLQLTRARTGACHVVDADGHWWRTYPFVEGTVTRERVTEAADAAAAGTAFGRFLGQLSDLPGDAMHVVIPDFHDTPRRLDQLDAAVHADVVDRVAACADEIAFVDQRRDFARLIVDALDSGAIPLRITHNDTKINNVLLDAETLEGRCVIDLDTLMPGSVLFDVGDLVRTSCNTAAEDEADISRVDCDLDVMRAAITGFARACELTDAERELLPICGQMMAFENGVRFLADYLAGDTYYKIDHPNHNLQRARAQFALVAACERQADAIAAICAEACKEVVP